MKVVLSPASQRDIRKIVIYIAGDSPVRARSLGLELRKRCHAIGDDPGLYPLAEHLGEGVRLVKHGVYFIFYVVEPDHVRIRRVIHGARLIDADMVRSS